MRVQIFDAGRRVYETVEYRPHDDGTASFETPRTDAEADAVSHGDVLQVREQRGNEIARAVVVVSVRGDPERAGALVHVRTVE